jgi:hypothetical protein
MASLKYLNTMLTVVAVLLAVHLWTWWSSPAGDRLTTFLPAAQAGEPVGIPDSGAQRVQMINELKQMNKKLDALTDLLRSGKARVRVEAAPNQGK